MAEIKSYTGTPTLFLDGRPAFNGLMWGSAPLLDSYALQDRARAYAKAGIHLSKVLVAYASCIGSSAKVSEVVGRPWTQKACRPTRARCQVSSPANDFA